MSHNRPDEGRAKKGNPMIKKHLPLKDGKFFEITDDWHKSNPDGGYCFELIFRRPDGTRVETEMKTPYRTPQEAVLAVYKHVTDFDEWNDSTEQAPENLSGWQDGLAPSKRPPAEH